MFKTWLKITLRGLRRNKVFTALNILGLAVGIGAALLIFLVIRYETGYDGYQVNRDRIYRVVTTRFNRSNGEIADRKGSVPMGLTDVIRPELPEIEKAAAVWNAGNAQIHVPGESPADGSGNGPGNEKIFLQKNIYFAEPELFHIFTVSWLAGNATDLKDPNTAVLSESAANTYFGNWKNALGRTIQMWSYRVPLRVAGVYKDLPENTDLPIQVAPSYATHKKLNQSGFMYDARFYFISPNSELFVLLHGGHDAAQSQAGLSQIVKKYYNEDAQKTPAVSRLTFQPLKELHLDDRYETYRGDALSEKVLWTLGLIGLFLLLVACINFVNLATAQSVNRAREIGVRKVLGGNRGQLMRQFMFETAQITVLSLVLACVLAQGSIPWLRQLMGKPISLDLLHTPVLWIFLLGTGVGVVGLAGFYPAVILSGFDPIEAIKSKISTRTIGGLSLRRSLVVMQFIIAQLLIIGTVVIMQQMKFFRDRPMGFDRAAIAMIDMPSDSTDQLKYDYLKSQFLQVRGVEAVSPCMDAPAGNYSIDNNLFYDNKPVKEDFKVSTQFADTGYLRVFHIGLVAGRLPANRDTGIREILVNELTTKKLGLRSPEQVLDKTIALDNANWKFRVVGVVHDFNSKSLREPLMPWVLTPNLAAYGLMAVRLEPSAMKEALARIQKIFVGVYPAYLYDVSFFDDRIAHFYQTEAVTTELIKMFAMLAIIISGLGLYGLVSFMTVQKTREVGIRKVLGASVQSILYLFSREFTILPGIAFLIAAPPGYFIMRHWLAGFYYHIELGPDIFLLAIAISLAIAWATVGYKALKAALANPVKNLRE